MEANDFATQRAYRGCLIALQSEQVEGGRWRPQASIMYTTREGHAGGHKVSIPDKTANTLELANGVAFELAKKWIDTNRELF
jgi:hypothetical protein